MAGGLLAINQISYNRSDLSVASAIGASAGIASLPVWSVFPKLIPGVIIKLLAQVLVVNRLASYIGIARGPASDRSPSHTLSNCGNSSRPVLRMNRPVLLM